MSRTTAAMIACAVGAALLFTLFPQLDLAAARPFHEPPNQWPLGRHPLILGVFHGITIATRVLVIALVLGIVAGLLLRAPGLRAQRRRMVFVLLVLVAGPGLVVNELLKDHWGRARPGQIVEFGGTQQFTPALLPTDQCGGNCSFVSGHVAAAFMPATLALIFPARRRLWIAGGTAFAALAGFGRMAAGGHFLSDVLFAMIVVWFVALLAYRIVYHDGRDPVPGSSAPVGDSR